MALASIRPKAAGLFPTFRPENWPRVSAGSPAAEPVEPLPEHTPDESVVTESTAPAPSATTAVPRQSQTTEPPATPKAVTAATLPSTVSSSTTIAHTAGTTVTPTLRPASNSPSYEVVGREALTLISYDWVALLPGWSIEFLQGRPGLLGGTWTYEKRIEIYVRDYQDASEVAFTLAHELGHAVDVTLLSEQDRQRWRALRAMTADVPWWVASGATDFSSGAGDWAESFAVWQTGGWSHSKVAPQPTATELAALAQLAR